MNFKSSGDLLWRVSTHLPLSCLRSTTSSTSTAAVSRRMPPAGEITCRVVLFTPYVALSVLEDSASSLLAVTGGVAAGALAGAPGFAGGVVGLAAATLLEVPGMPPTPE